MREPDRVTVLLAPDPTGSGPTTRALALAGRLRLHAPGARLAVLLDPAHSAFGRLFGAVGAEVVTVPRTGRETYADGDACGDRMLGHLACFHDIAPDLVVGDDNLAAGLAAAVAGIPYALVTGRYDIAPRGDGRGADSLRSVFDKVVSSARLVLTDKPYVPETDAGSPVARALAEGRAVVSGPLVRDVPERVDAGAARASLGLGPGPLLVASVGGAGGSRDDRQRVVERCVLVHRRLLRLHPALRFVLLTRDWVEVPDDVVVRRFVPDRPALLRAADVLVATPGWATVVEAAVQRVPAVFVAGGLDGLRAAESFDRVERLGFPALLAPTSDELEASVRPFIGDRPVRPTPAQLAVAPEGSGAARAARLLADAALAVRAGGSHAGGAVLTG
ncbi:hypothetical protein ACFV29_39250 [Streptomyces sp. NPDC059690]|uniref:hypothetical protein n=1 Tax=Streptomyces sp. NPDC059690 TaxID=3346907 RepID=UPI00367ECD18